MKKNIIQLCTLGAMLLITSCSKAEPEIITEDPTYKIDPKEVYVDTPAKFVYNTDNILRNESERIVSLNVNLVDGTPVLETTTIPLTFRLRRPLAEDLTITLEEDRSLLAKYVGDQTDVLPLPEGTLSGLTATIPAGSLTYTTNISVTNANLLTDTKGYLTAFRFVVPEGANMSEDAKVMYVRVTVREPEVVLVDGVDSSWRELTNTTDYRISPMAIPFDPKWTTNSRTILYIRKATLSSPSISGLAIYTRSTASNKTIKSLRMRAYAYDVAEAKDYGVLNVPESKEVIYIKFAQPITVRTLELSNFVAFAGTSVEIHDIKVYSKQ